MSPSVRQLAVECWAGPAGIPRRRRGVAGGEAGPTGPGRRGVVRRAAVLVLVLVPLLVAGCSTPPPAPQNMDPQCATGVLTGAGATFQQNMQARWISDFTTRCYTTTVTYDPVGSGGGIERFIAGSVDFAGSDALMTDEEQRSADARCARAAAPGGGASRPGEAVAGASALHLPLVGGALVFLYNVPGVERLRLAPATVAGIFQGEIGRWDDPRVASDNPGVDLPALAVRPVHRADSSGSTSILGEYLSAAAPQHWRLGAGKVLPWPDGSLAADGSDGVTAAVGANPGGITYAELSFAAKQGLPTAALANPSGKYVKANGISVAAALANATLDERHRDPRMLINYTPADPAAYPASAVTYGIVCSANNTYPELLRSYLGYALTNGQDSTDEIGYAPVGGAGINLARRLAADLG